MTEFVGFKPEALAFFKALGFHQDREWFQENKPLFEAGVREPMIALLEELSERFEKAGIPLRGDKRSMFRINRDIRFSKDKRPYQTHTGAVLTRSGTKNDDGLLYVHVTADNMESMGGSVRGSFMAAGFHRPDSDMLTSVRSAIKRNPKAFQEMEAALKKSKLTLETGNQLTRVPRGFEDMKGSPIEGALRLKSYIVEGPLTEAVVTSPKLVDALVKFTQRALPLLEFGWKATG